MQHILIYNMKLFKYIYRLHISVATIRIVRNTRGVFNSHSYIICWEKRDGAKATWRGSQNLLSFKTTRYIYGVFVLLRTLIRENGWKYQNPLNVN